MKLASWLASKEMTPAEFGRIIGLPQPTVHRYANGQRIPERDTMAKIVAATGGEVTPNDFYDVPSVSNAQASA